MRFAVPNLRLTAVARRKWEWLKPEGMYFRLVEAFLFCCNHSVPAATEVFARSLMLANAPKRTKI